MGQRLTASLSELPDIRLTKPRRSRWGWVRDAVHDLTVRPPSSIAALDVLRTIAVLLVISGHISGAFQEQLSIFRLPLFYYGWTGVDLFFVLSGFLIGRQLWNEMASTGRVDIVRFILRRGLRIWPLYYSLASGLIAIALVSGRSTDGFLADLFFVSNYFHCRIGGGWSLSTEEHFYILLPVLLLVSCRFLRLRHMWVVPFSWLVALPLSRALSIALSPGKPVHDVVYAPFHTHADGLAAGVLLSWCTVMLPGWWQRRTLLKDMGIPALGMLTALCLYRINRELFDFSALALIYASVVFSLLRVRTVPAFFRNPAFYALSRLSYGMYLNHFGLLPKLVAIVKKAFGPGYAGFGALYAGGLAISVLLAGITFALIERPFLLFRDRILSHKRRETLTAAGRPASRLFPKTQEDAAAA